jgi:multiple sugar transport system substrate-binding protein
MREITRRAVIRKSLGLAAAGTLVRPYISGAAATTAEVWWPQGFIPEEDTALKKAVADYEKASGNQIDLNIAPFAPQRQKIVAAVTSGVVPDMFRSSPDEAVALFAWEDMLVDVSDVVETQKEEFSETALLNTYCYNRLTKQRAFYACPMLPRRARTTYGAHWSRRPATRSRTSRRPGTPIMISSKTCKKSWANRGCATSTAWAFR